MRGHFREKAQKHETTGGVLGTSSVIGVGEREREITRKIGKAGP